LQPTDNNLSTLRSYNSGGPVDFFSEAFQSSGSGNSLPSGPARSVSLDLSKPPAASASSIDLFQTVAPSQSALGDLFQLSDKEAAPSFKGSQPTQTSQVASVDFFANLPQQPSAATSDAKSVELPIPKNEGWATFDTPQFTSSTTQVEIPAAVPSSAESLQDRFYPFSTAQVEIPAPVPSSAESLQDRFDPFSTFNGNMKMPSFEVPSVGVPSSVTSNTWHDGVWNGEKQIPAMATGTQVSPEVWSIIWFCIFVPS